MSEKKDEKKKLNPVTKALKKDVDPLESLDRKLFSEMPATREANERYAHDPKYHGHSKLRMRATEIICAVAAVIIGSL